MDFWTFLQIFFFQVARNFFLPLVTFQDYFRCFFFNFQDCFLVFENFSDIFRRFFYDRFFLGNFLLSFNIPGIFFSDINVFASGIMYLLLQTFFFADTFKFPEFCVIIFCAFFHNINFFRYFFL